MSEITNKDREAARAFIGTPTEKHLPYWHANETRLAQAFADYRAKQANATRSDHVASADKMIAGIPTDKLAEHVAAVARLREAAEKGLDLVEMLTRCATHEGRFDLATLADHWRNELAAALAAMEGSK